MANFDLAYLVTMGHEGLYSNDPRDRGGETWKGIARTMHPDWPGWVLVDSVKKQAARNNLAAELNKVDELEACVQLFYETLFWKANKLDEITDQEIANEVFDTGVNQGARTAAMYLQEALNLLNNNQKHYSDLKVDGAIGPQTLKAYHAYMFTANFPGRSGFRNVHTLLKALNFFQLQRYIEICEKTPGQEVYFYGWVNRV